MSSPIQKLDLDLNSTDLHLLQVFLSECSYWNANKLRTTNNSPHREADDIWARFGDLNDPNVAADKPFQAHWYYQDLRRVLEPLVNAVYHHVQGKELGGVLITRIPPGKQVFPHIDRGWHATHHSKYCICVSATDKQVFAFDDASLVCKTGDVFFFDNSYRHWVKNDDASEPRISVICCIRTERGIHTP